MVLPEPRGPTGLCSRESISPRTTDAVDLTLSGGADRGNELHKLLHIEATKLDDGKTARDRIFKGAKLRPAYFAAILKLNAR